MSEIEVSHISDEDVLRRMWQQTEDFSRKKEIRAHMYRLREERLRNLYSPEPANDGKGCEFSSAQGHSQSFADQTFQSMKSKEVRDAGSPPKEFAYRGQDLKEHSNAGWNVESEDRITDDGRTHVKSVNANIEGRYDVEGGRGQFTAIDRQRQAVTEHHDDRSSLRRDERSATTAAHDHVVRQTDDGARISSTTNSSNTSSSIQQVSSTKHETVPYVTDDDYNQGGRLPAPDVSRNERITRITNSDDFEHTSRRSDDASSEIVSRKVDYPDDNTKVIVETRRLPDGTRVTSTRREFRAPAQTTRSEYQTKNETQSYSSQHKSNVRDVRDFTSNFTRQTIDDRTNDIVDSQRIVDDSDFKRQLREYTTGDDENNEDLHRRHATKIDRKVTDYTQTDDDYSQKIHERTSNNRTVDSTDDRDHTETRRRATGRRYNIRVDEVNRQKTNTSHDHDVHEKIVKESRTVNDTKERINVTRERNDTEEKTYHISRDQKNVSEKIDTTNENRTPIKRSPDEPRDKTIPVDKVTYVSEDVPVDRLRDVSMGETPSLAKFRDIPKDPKIVDNLHDNPADRVVSSGRIKDSHKDKTTTDERVHHITKNTNVEEIVEKKTSSDHYQTTYQNDFQTRKISTDWSPTHQAWASTLRSDTPSTTHPSTRASSPGSKTFKSSTSSLRSSVSPDKTPRKPVSRGGSPNKVDRTSPTRSVTSDRYSSTRSTYSITEVQSNKNTSPERKPPTGRSPTRPGYSPDRKPHDIPRQRPSVSPEKRPQSFTDRPSSSPDRRSPVKPNSKDKHSRTPSPSAKYPSSSLGPNKSPEKKPSSDGYLTDTFPQTSPYRSTTSPNRIPTEEYLKRSSPRSSPDRKPSSQKDSSPSRRHPLNDSSKTVTSPDVKPGYQQPQQPGKPLDEYHEQSSTKKPSVSPERKPGYMRPTAASRPNDDKTKKLVKPVNESDNKSPTKHDSLIDSTSEHFIRTSKIKEDHYKFVDEETKVYTHSNQTNIDNLKMTTTHPRNSSPSHIPSEDSPDFCKMPDTKGKSPSPQRNSNKITKHDDLYGKIDKTIEKVDTYSKQNQRCEEITTTNIERKSKNKVSPTRNEPSRETSPSKYDTYEKKKTRENRTTTEETKDSLISEKHKIIPKNVDNVPSSSTRRSPRDSTSPVKSPTKDLRVKHTTDFLNTERNIEEINKKVTSRPRELITPSSSPTRKQKVTDTEPSTGQSSPTTSVSGFIYFGSPRSETDLVTDLDENYPEAENKEEIFKRPETLDVKRSPSPSKIPCRSPSPEKHVPSIKDSLPRKSSLKKPSTNVNQASPVEKPPTSFRVSPTNDKPVETGHKTIKKDHPREPETGESEPLELDFTSKPKPPLQRRETYEDRCKKILGMVEDTTSDTVIKNVRSFATKTDSNQSSLSVSPCGSPVPKELSPLSDYLDIKKTTTTKNNVSDFIKHEREDLSKSTKANININKKVTSREHSPTKPQQDFYTESTQNISDTIKKHVKVDEITKNVNTTYSSSTRKPEKSDFQNSEEIEYADLHNKIPVDTLDEKSNKHPSKSPERKPSKSNLKLDSKPESKYSDKTTQSKASPEKTLTFSKTTTSNIDELKQKTHKTTVDEIQEEIREATTNIQAKTHPTRVLESPTRQIPDTPGFESSEHPQSTVPSRPQTKDKSPSKGNIKTPQCKSERPNDINIENQEPDEKTQMRRSKSPEKVPHYMKTTTTKSQCDMTYGTDNVDKSYTTEARARKESQSKSPTRQLAQNQPGSPNKPGHVIRPDSLLPEYLPKEMLSKTPRNEEPKNATKPHVPGYMKTTTAITSKFDVTVSDVSHEKNTNIRKSSKNSPDSRTPSPTKPSRQFGISPERKTSSPQQPSPPTKDAPKNQQSKYQKSSSPTKIAPDETPGYMKTTAAVTSKYDTAEYTTEDVQEKITSTTKSDHPDLRKSLSPTRQIRRPTIESTQEHLRSTSPSRPSHPSSRKDDLSPQRNLSTPDEHSLETPNNRTITDCNRYSESNDSKDTQDILESKTRHKSSSSRTPHSPERQSPILKAPECEPNVNIDYLSKPEDSRQLRTPSPAKKTIRNTEESTDFIMSEREQEILNKVQKSLRKLSPERKVKSPSRERSPAKTTTSLQDLDISSKETIQSEYEESETVEKQAILSKVVQRRPTKEDITSASKLQGKPSSRNVSPLKKTPSTTNKFDKTPESPTKSRSISPKKPVSHVDRPQSPQVPKVSGIKPRDQIPYHLTRKPTPATLSATKIERLTTEVKKTNGTTKQNVFTKTAMSKTATRTIPSPTTKISESDFKRTLIPKGTKDNVSPKKDSVSRTTSDITMKPKKPSSPQRMKSKPEIQVSDMSTKTPKSQKPTIKEPYSKLPTKPKSATALNTSTDEDDVIIDVQQSKSSRENSPDRICPTPINFCDDVGTPRFPDEVSEPDDEIVKRSYHTIHETESLVDDIVEICEDEELFSKKSDFDVITEHDDSLLSVNDKVSKFTSKIQSVRKPKDTTILFKDKEKRVHSDFIEENLKSDECLLTVSEKVNKFAKGPRDTNESRSPSRKITDEYDNNTVYTDDYTKLSVNDKAHLFVETSENIQVAKLKPAQKVERPDLSHVDESLKSDDCLLSVSDKVNKFVKTAEQYMTETQLIEDTDSRIKEQHELILRQITDETNEEDTDDLKETISSEKLHRVNDKTQGHHVQKKPKTHASKPQTKPTERVPAVKITTLRSSEAVKKAKALFENIASTQKTTQKDATYSTKHTKLTDIGVIKKSSETDSTTVLHPSVEDVSPQVTDTEIEMDAPFNVSYQTDGLTTKPRLVVKDEKPRGISSNFVAQTPQNQKSKSPVRQSVETTTTRTVLSRYPGVTRAESPRQRAESPRHRPESPRQRTESPRQRPESDKPDKTPGYLRPTKTSQIKEETKAVEEVEVSSRRGSGKFGVELRRTSVERSTVSSERRRSVEHHQPCIEDIFDLDLLEQMLEKVVGYEQRRRIRAQIRIARNQSEHTVKTNTYTKTSKHTTTTTKTRSPDRKDTSPDRDGTSKSVPHKTASPERHSKTTPHKQIHNRTQSKESATNGHTKESVRTAIVTRQRLHSPEKPVTKTSLPRTPVRQPSPDKRRTGSPTKSAPKTKGNRFNEYASAYMKKVGLNEADKIKFTDAKVKKATETKQTVKHEKQQETVQEFTTTKSFTERTSSQDVIEVVHTNGRSPSPEKRASPERKVQLLDRKNQVLERKQQSPERKTHSPGGKAHTPDRKVHLQERRTYSPERKAQSPERLHQRTSSPDFKRPKVDTVKETIIKTVYDIEKKIPSKPVQEEKPSWVTNRNLKKITSETRTFSSKKIENEKPKYRASSPSKVISKPIDVITSSYGPGPLDADGKPLFGIKALRNGASNFQVKGTVIRSEFHSRNGGEPQGSVSVTAYSSQPEELEQLLASQGEPPSRIHGLAAITTTKKFGGDTGNTLANVHTKEDRASLEQFTHHDRRVEHLERTYDSTQEFSEDTRTEVSGHRRIEPKVEQTEKIDRSTKITEVKRSKMEERREKMDRREDKKTVRQSSVKSLTEKYIKSANDSGKADRGSYPKAGLILRTTTMRDSVSSDDANPGGLVRTDSEHSLGSAEEVVTTTTTHSHRPGHTTHTRTTITTHEPAVVTKKTTVVTQEPTITRRVVTHDPVVQNITRSDGKVHQETVTMERSFLDSSTKVTGVQDILTRMKNADIVIQEGDSTEDSEARALLNKFLGATVLMAGMQGYVQEQPAGKLVLSQETVRSGGGAKVTSHNVEDLDLDQCWDERLLRKLLEECTEYEQRRRLRARLRSLMAEQEACASAVTEALGAAGAEVSESGDAREEEEVTVTSSVRRDSSDKTVSSSTTTKTTKVIEMTRPAPKPVSPFAKFRQLEKQNSTNSPNSPKTPQSPGSPSQPYFKFTDPALQCSALTIKERLLQWCRDKTRDYENVKLENFSTSWADGLAFCALVHHFLPDTFDYSKLTADKRRHNFTLAFKVADEKAGIYPLLDVDDMVAMRKPDWKCVFTYVQAIYRRFKDEQ